jgi:hypothetical protein
MLETEAYLEGLSSVSNIPLQPIRLGGFNAKISRFQIEAISESTTVFPMKIHILAMTGSPITKFVGCPPFPMVTGPDFKTR